MEQFRFDAQGFVTGHETLPDGEHRVTLEGEEVAPADGGRRNLTVTFLRFPTGSPTVTEGELTLRRPEDGEIYATLTEGSVADEAPALEDTPRSSVTLDFEVTEPGAALPERTGAARFEGTVTGNQFRGTVAVRLD